MFLLKIIFGVLFIIFAALQYNDPDPWLWISIYTAVAGILFLDASGRNVKPAYIIGLILLSLLGLIYFPSVMEFISRGEPEELIASMQAAKPYIEETREFGGLLIIIFVMLGFLRAHKNH